MVKRQNISSIQTPAIKTPETQESRAPVTTTGPKKRFERHLAKVMPGRLSKPSVRRLCRRAGVKRINSGVYTESGEALKAWLKLIVGDIRLLVEHGRRMTVTVNDVLIALKRRGRTLYGFSK